jgi:hypothetical protein
MTEFIGICIQCGGYDPEIDYEDCGCEVCND